jgi:ABC-2 type transport system permease protein
VAGLNPVTYLLDGMRTLVLGDGWAWTELGQALLAIAVVGVISMTLCFAALRGRVRSGA